MFLLLPHSYDYSQQKKNKVKTNNLQTLVGDCFVVPSVHLCFFHFEIFFLRRSQLFKLFSNVVSAMEKQTKFSKSFENLSK